MPIIKHKGTKRRAEQNKQADLERGSARERGYTARWDRFARNFLKRHPLCRYCETQGITKPSELVDHVRPHRGDRGLFWPGENDDWDTFFAASCRACHNGPKQRAELYAERAGVDLIDVLIKRGMLPRSFRGDGTQN